MKVMALRAPTRTGGALFQSASPVCDLGTVLLQGHRLRLSARQNQPQQPKANPCWIATTAEGGLFTWQGLAYSDRVRGCTRAGV